MSKPLEERLAEYAEWLAPYALPNRPDIQLIARDLTEAAREIERFEGVIAAAYQAAGALLDSVGSFEMPHSQRLLDFLASEGRDGEPPMNGELAEEAESAMAGIERL